MIQDIYPYVFHNEFRPDAVPKKNSPVLCFKEDRILARADEEGDRLVFPEASLFEASSGQLTFAFCVDETEYFLLRGTEEVSAEGFAYLDLRSIRKNVSNVWGMIAFTGYHLYAWYRDAVFCGRCGAENEHALSERAMHCPSCGKHFYPRIMPAVIVAVLDGDRLLVTKYNTGYKHYALVAGFTEIGETLEETVCREVLEETGLAVENIRYYKSQPWGIANDLLAGFFCDVKGSTEIRLDGEELKLAEWKTREEIELQPDSYSLTNEMMRLFKEGKTD